MFFRNFTNRLMKKLCISLINNQSRVKGIKTNQKLVTFYYFNPTPLWPVHLCEIPIQKGLISVTLEIPLEMLDTRQQVQVYEVITCPLINNFLSAVKHAFQAHQRTFITDILYRSVHSLHTSRVRTYRRV